MAVSIVVPALNEASCLAGTLRSLRELNPFEILVVDGGSDDATAEEAREADVVLRSPPGRAAQMNLGAEAARGDVLLFLHADCWLGAGALRDAERLLARPGVAAGCFRMTVSSPRWVYRVIDAAATARVLWAGVAYGDQGLFVRRDVFARAGGFPDLRFMEDVFVCPRLRRFGRLVVAPSRIYVSDRRWRKYGVTRQSLRNWGLTGLAMAGVHPDRLARFYPAAR